MLAPFASMQLESDLPRFGNPNRFNPVGKCSSRQLIRCTAHARNL